jgi:hypothetical protein
MTENTPHRLGLTDFDTTPTASSVLETASDLKATPLRYSLSQTSVVNQFRPIFADFSFFCRARKLKYSCEYSQSFEASAREIYFCSRSFVTLFYPLKFCFTKFVAGKQKKHRETLRPLRCFVQNPVELWTPKIFLRGSAYLFILNHHQIAGQDARSAASDIKNILPIAQIMA